MRQGLGQALGSLFSFVGLSKPSNLNRHPSDVRAEVLAPQNTTHQNKNLDKLDKLGQLISKSSSISRKAILEGAKHYFSKIEYEGDRKLIANEFEPRDKDTKKAVCVLFSKTNKWFEVVSKKLGEINFKLRTQSKHFIENLTSSDLLDPFIDIKPEIAVSLAPKSMTRKFGGIVTLEERYSSNTRFFNALIGISNRQAAYTSYFSADYVALNPRTKSEITKISKKTSEKLAGITARGVVLNRTKNEDFESIMFVPRHGPNNQHFVDMFISENGKLVRKCFATKDQALKIAAKFSSGRSVNLASAMNHKQELALLDKPALIRD